MALHPLAGKLAPQHQLANLPRLIADYYLLTPDVAASCEQQVSFGTSGHRGSSSNRTFNQHHLLAIAQAICDFRQTQNISGPMLVGMDTHALSEPAFCSVIEVLVANGVRVLVQQQRGYSPTPVISHGILQYNLHHPNDLADGIVITPSHNPPQDGGLKYNGLDGGPADTQVTKWVQNRANELLRAGLSGVKRVPFDKAYHNRLVKPIDFAVDYIEQLAHVIDMAAIAQSGLNIAIEPLGGSGLHYWERIASRYQLNIELLNDNLDPRFGFVPCDKDGIIRMDCSSPFCMVDAIDKRHHYDLVIGNDPDYDRHGIVTKAGLMNANQYLVVAVHYLLTHRSQWSKSGLVGRSLMATSMIDRVVEDLGHQVFEVPVGFKWFVDKMHQGELLFAGEDSAGASFVRIDGKPWGTDKDGFILGLLAAEIHAVTGKDVAQYYQSLTEQYGEPIYRRIDVKASFAQKAKFKQLDKSMVTVTEVAGEAIKQVISHAPGNDRHIGGLKIVTENGWFAARPSGTESLYKIYLESFKGEQHMQLLEQEARRLVSEVLT